MRPNPSDAIFAPPQAHLSFPVQPRERIAIASWPFRQFIEAPENKWARDPKLPGMDLTEGILKRLKAGIDPELIKAYRGTVSLPFESGKYSRIAVKIVDDRGIESLKVVEVA